MNFELSEEQKMIQQRVERCVQEKYELTDARKAALFALIDLAVAWHGAPEVLYFVENSKGIDASRLRHVVVQLSRTTLPPYSFRFAHAVPTLLSCFKAKQRWHSAPCSLSLRHP